MSEADHKPFCLSIKCAGYVPKSYGAVKEVSKFALHCPDCGSILIHRKKKYRAIGKRDKPTWRV